VSEQNFTEGKAMLNILAIIYAVLCNVQN